MKYLSGKVYSEDGFFGGYVAVEDGRVVETGEGKCPEKPVATGVIVPQMADCHTHCADAGVKVRPGMTLEELVAPPDGLKHVYLRTAPRETLVRDMRGFSGRAASNGIAYYLDFREGGVPGCRMLREASDRAVILGRPVSPEFDQGEVDSLLEVADGIALSSVSDIDPRYAEKVADAAHAAGKTFAIHASERVREDMDLVMSLQPDFLVHMVEATDSDLRACRDADVPIVVCPRSNRFFGKAAPIARMLEAGCDVALGTDNAMLCSPDMRPEAALAAELLRGQGGDPSAVWDLLIKGGRKLLNRARIIGRTIGTDGTAAVLPCPGSDPGGALGCTEPVYVP